MVNELLQKELLSYMSPKSTWGIYTDSTDNNGHPAVNSEWSLVTTKNHPVKSKKRDTSATVKTGQLMKTANRYTPLTRVFNAHSSGPREQSEWTSTQNIHTTKKQQRTGIKIPTIVNGKMHHQIKLKKLLTL
jgi:hypothetical protein